MMAKDAEVAHSFQPLMEVSRSFFWGLMEAKWPMRCCAKQSLGGGDGESMSETSHRNPVGNQSHPVRVSHPPEASLASSSVMAARSVDSECKSRVIEPRNKAKS